MRYRKAGARFALGKAVLAVGGVLAASAAFAGSASAAVFVINPPTGNTSQQNGALLSTAINNANSSTDASSTIILREGLYAPTAPPAAIAKNLTITGDHQNAQLNGGTAISGVNMNPADQVFMTINPGATLTLEAISLRGGGVSAGAAPAQLVDNGNLLTYNASINANLSNAELQVNAGATATLNDSGVTDSAGTGIDIESGTVTLNHANVVFNQQGGITQNGTLNVNNSILTNNDPGSIGFQNCTSTASTSDHSYDSDNSCGLTDPGSKHGSAAATPGISPTNKNGGPIPTNKLAATFPAVGAANQTSCPMVDGRFFALQGATKPPCDMGAWQTGATQVTTPPSCVVTGVSAGPPKTQTVTLSDAISGLGPEAGTTADAANTGPVPPVGNNQGDVVDGLTITNGTVLATGFSPSGPSSSPVTLTATKTDQTMLTQWSFTATNWAGISTLCK